MRSTIMTTAICALAALLSSCGTTGLPTPDERHMAIDSEKTLIFADSKPLMPVVLAKSADEKTREAAEELVEYLNKITGGRFILREGDGTTGIAVGTINDFPKLDFKPAFDLHDPGERQGYAIKSHGNGVYVLGATPQAVSYAVFDLLHRFGFRRYFPMEKWTIIPRRKTLEFSQNIRETPDYYSRNH